MSCQRAMRWSAGVVLGGAAVCALVFGLRLPDSGGPRAVEGSAPPPQGPPAPSAPMATRPAAPAAAVVLPETPREPFAAPCEGCLRKEAALDIAETFLVGVDRNYLQGGLRAELYADIPGDPYAQQLPPLPPGLEGAPSGYSVGVFLPRLPAREREETWVVWFQTGWLTYSKLEEHIEVGWLPDVARSWPPIKLEHYVLVNARTGALQPDGVYRPTSHGFSETPAMRLATRAARDRADHWLTTSTRRETSPKDG